jgi:hypothetical protein
MNDINNEIARARETLRRLEAEDRERMRRVEEQQREQPGDVVCARALWDATNPRDHKSPASMSHAEFNAWVDAGRPALTRNGSKDDPKRVAAHIREHVERRLDAVMSVVGEEVAQIENGIRADHKRELDALREELAMLRQQQRAAGDDATVLELPQWPSWSDDAARH